MAIDVLKIAEQQRSEQERKKSALRRREQARWDLFCRTTRYAWQLLAPLDGLSVSVIQRNPQVGEASARHVTGPLRVLRLVRRRTPNPPVAWGAVASDPIDSNPVRVIEERVDSLPDAAPDLLPFEAGVGLVVDLRPSGVDQRDQFLDSVLMCKAWSEHDGSVVVDDADDPDDGDVVSDSPGRRVWKTEYPDHLDKWKRAKGRLSTTTMAEEIAKFVGRFLATKPDPTEDDGPGHRREIDL